MLLPVTYRVNSDGRMEVGGCDLVELARSHGTPLYVYDEETVRLRCREFRDALGAHGEVLYSAKAFSSPGFLRVVASEGLGVDVVSEGELRLAQAAGFTGEQIHFLGNNKSRQDLAAACAAGRSARIRIVGCVSLMGRNASAPGPHGQDGEGSALAVEDQAGQVLGGLAAGQRPGGRDGAVLHPPDPHDREGRPLADAAIEGCHGSPLQ